MILDKKYKDYKKFYEKADGGAIGIEVLFEEKKDGGRIGFANGGENIIGSTVDKFFTGPAMDHIYKRLYGICESSKHF
jgi:hypothetical protein